MHLRSAAPPKQFSGRTTMKHSVQVYSIRNFGDFEAQLGLVSKFGFSWVETVATHALPPQDFARQIDRHSLGVSSMHANSNQLRDQYADLVNACRLTNCPLIVLPSLPAGERPFDAPAIDPIQSLDPPIKSFPGGALQ